MSSGRPLSHPLTSRLMGLETEYATLVADAQDLEQDDLPPARLVYSQICAAIGRDQPLVHGVFDQDQLFLANGAAVSFESHPSREWMPGGLLEVATPEVHRPSDLLACQRAIDEIAAEATAESETSFDLRLLKNSSDALGHVYGCQENYEAEVAHGSMLILYRGFVLLLMAMQVISLTLSLPLMSLVMLLVIMQRWRRKPPHSESEFELEELNSEQSSFHALPRFVSVPLVGMLRVIHLPTVLILGFVGRHVAFRAQRRFLTGFLASRVALCGTGNLDPEGRFQISARAMAIDSVAHMGSYRGERPIFVYGHWLSQFCARSFLSLSATIPMLRRRQRLQIGLSDSNLSELAEYVKIGSASLVLDLIESGQTQRLPVLKQVVASVHHLSSDWNLVARVPTSRGKLSALELQKIYLSEARQFVENTPADRRGESELVLYRWQELLDAATAYRKDANDTDLAVGRVDWLTKKYMMDELGESAEWTERKKVDLRYHELSKDGYFSKLIELRSDLKLVDQAAIERFRRSPPSESPAARRGWMIREFADGEGGMHSDWTFALLGQGRSRRKVVFRNDSNLHTHS